MKKSANIQIMKMKTDNDPLFNCDPNKWSMIVPTDDNDDNNIDNNDEGSSRSDDNKNTKQLILHKMIAGSTFSVITSSTTCISDEDDCDSRDNDNSSTSSIRTADQLLLPIMRTSVSTTSLSDNYHHHHHQGINAAGNNSDCSSDRKTATSNNKGTLLLSAPSTKNQCNIHNDIPPLPLHPHATIVSNTSLSALNNVYNNDEDRCKNPNSTSSSSSSSSSLSSSIESSDDYQAFMNTSNHSNYVYNPHTIITNIIQQSTSDCISSNTTHFNKSSISSLPSLNYDEFTFIEHIVLPNDTLQGITLQYKVSAMRLRQFNKFSGSNLSLAPRKLYIPIKKKMMYHRIVAAQNKIADTDGNDCAARHLSVNSCTSSGRSIGIRIQDVNSREYKVHKVLAECPSIGRKEVQAYLELHDWEVNRTITYIKEADTQQELDYNLSNRKNMNECNVSLDIPYTPSSYHLNNDHVNIKLRVINNDDEGSSSTIHCCDPQVGNNSIGDLQNTNKLYDLEAMKEDAEKWEELNHPNRYKSFVDKSEPMVSCFDFETVVNKQREANEKSTSEKYHKAPQMDYGIEMKEFNSGSAKHPQMVSVLR